MLMSEGEPWGKESGRESPCERWSAVSVISPWNFHLPLTGNEVRQMSLFILQGDYQNARAAEQRRIWGANTVSNITQNLALPRFFYFSVFTEY